MQATIKWMDETQGSRDQAPMPDDLGKRTSLVSTDTMKKLKARGASRVMMLTMKCNDPISLISCHFSVTTI